jgi:hypothetical protein
MSPIYIPVREWIAEKEVEYEELADPWLGC